MLATQVVTNTARWPAGTVLYDQSGTNSPTGHRPDCSGYASMCLGLPTPGENTVTLLTKGIVHPIAWAELAPGDVVGALGPGTMGDVGHVMVVTAVNHAAGVYDVMEQGGGYGPDHNTYRIGDGQGRGFLPYRLSTLEDDEMSDQTLLWVISGADAGGVVDPAKYDGDLKLIAERTTKGGAFNLNLQSLSERIAGLEEAIEAGGYAGVDLSALAEILAAKLPPPPTAAQVAAAIIEQLGGKKS